MPPQSIVHEHKYKASLWEIQNKVNYILAKLFVDNGMAASLIVKQMVSAIIVKGLTKGILGLTKGFLGLKKWWAVMFSFFNLCLYNTGLL